MAFVFNGHVLDTGAGRLVGVGDHGNRVYQILANYQFQPYGGGGFLRLIEFFPDQARMSVRSYAPYLNKSHTGDSRYEFAYTNLGMFSNTGPTYLIDSNQAIASVTIISDDLDLSPPDVDSLRARGLPQEIIVQFN